MKTHIVTIYRAITNFSRLLQKVSYGEEVIILRGSHPVARLLPLGNAKGQRQPGGFKRATCRRERVFEPLPKDELPA